MPNPKHTNPSSGYSELSINITKKLDKEEKKKLLENCYQNCLELAVKNNIKTIAFPNISTGIYHFPKDKAATIAIETVSNFNQKDKIDEVVFVCFDDENYDLYKNTIK